MNQTENRFISNPLKRLLEDSKHSDESSQKRQRTDEDLAISDPLNITAEDTPSTTDKQVAITALKHLYNNDLPAFTRIYTVNGPINLNYTQKQITECPITDFWTRYIVINIITKTNERQGQLLIGREQLFALDYFAVMKTDEKMMDVFLEQNFTINDYHLFFSLPHATPERWSNLSNHELHRVLKVAVYFFSSVLIQRLEEEILRRFQSNDAKVILYELDNLPDLASTVVPKLHTAVQKAFMETIFPSNDYLGWLSNSARAHLTSFSFNSIICPNWILDMYDQERWQDETHIKTLEKLATELNKYITNLEFTSINDREILYLEKFVNLQSLSFELIFTEDLDKLLNVMEKLPNLHTLKIPDLFENEELKKFRIAIEKRGIKLLRDNE